MAKKKTTPKKLTEAPAPDLINLADWVSLREAVNLRIEIGHPLTKQQLLTLWKDKKITAREVFGVKVWLRAELVAYRGKRGRPTKLAEAETSA